MRPSKRPSKHGFQGPVFQSFIKAPEGSGSNPNKNRSLPQGKTWLSHANKRARMKNLRNATRSTTSSKDPDIILALNRIREGVTLDPTPEFAFLHLVFIAQNTSAESGATFVESVTYMMDQWDTLKTETIKEVEAGEHNIQKIMKKAAEDGTRENSIEPELVRLEGDGGRDRSDEARPISDGDAKISEPAESGTRCD